MRDGVSFKRLAALDFCSLYVHHSGMVGNVMAPGMLLARGVSRALLQLGFVPICEYTLNRNFRVDVLALGPKGEIWIIECKSGLADYRADTKWSNYLPWCDQFFWAVGPDFPQAVLPEGHGLFLADGYGAEMVMMGETRLLSPARRKALIRDVARVSARRLYMHLDPHGAV